MDMSRPARAGSLRTLRTSTDDRQRQAVPASVYILQFQAFVPIMVEIPPLVRPAGGHLSSDARALTDLACSLPEWHFMRKPSDTMTLPGSTGAMRGKKRGIRHISVSSPHLLATLTRPVTSWSRLLQRNQTLAITRFLPIHSDMDKVAWYLP